MIIALVHLRNAESKPPLIDQHITKDSPSAREGKFSHHSHIACWTETRQTCARTRARREEACTDTDCTEPEENEA